MIAKMLAVLVLLALFLLPLLAGRLREKLDSVAPRLERREDIEALGIAPVAIWTPERFPSGILLPLPAVADRQIRTLIDYAR